MARSAEPAGRDIVVIGASAGGVEALSYLAGALPHDLPAALFVVLHLAPEGTSFLPQILRRAGPLPADHAADGAPILPGRIYVAPPDRHLLLEPDRVRVVFGPHENRHRPAIDPLFRTAARVYDGRVIGVILTGTGDDGAAGLLEVSRRGGTTIVQDPADALYPAMPRSAVRAVPVQYCLPLRDIPAVIVELCRQPPPVPVQEAGDGVKGVVERIPTRASPEEGGELPSAGQGFTCPHCHGPLWEVEHEGVLHFRCRVGHALSAESLLTAEIGALEATLWAAINAFEEHATLCRRMLQRSEAHGWTHSARRLAARAQDAEAHSRQLRKLLETLPFPSDASQAPGNADT